MTPNEMLHSHGEVAVRDVTTQEGAGISGGVCRYKQMVHVEDYLIMTHTMIENAFGPEVMELIWVCPATQK